MIIHPHGGPEGQHRPNFSPIIQFLTAQLGVAVIDPNVRGSDGYGKVFVSLDNAEKREDSVKDIGALLDWVETLRSEPFLVPLLLLFCLFACLFDFGFAFPRVWSSFA